MGVSKRISQQRKNDSFRVQKRTQKPQGGSPSKRNLHTTPEGPEAAVTDAPIDITIPFDPHDRILLVGEGDFSFAHSIVQHHGCADVLATCFDDKTGLLEKYPQAAEHIAYLESEEQRVLCGVDATKLNQRQIRKGRKWDKIVFNFPHIGGKSTDVNRQVRYNQELLAGFFKQAMHLLSSEGSVLVTLFDGHPYTLWNIKDLARHVGLKVARSFAFHPSAYPQYKHARTLGNLMRGERGNSGGEGEAAPGAWQAQNRAARTFQFVTKDGTGTDLTEVKWRKDETDESD